MKGWFVGSSYQSQSVNADCQKSLNWYEEHIESGNGKSPSVLYPCPGKKFFCNLPNENYVPSLFPFNGRLFAAGNHLWEIYPNGARIDRGALTNPNGNSTMMAANQASQLLIACGGNLYIFNLAANTLRPVDMTQLQGKVDQIGFTDGYFVALIRNSNIFQLSNLLDGTTWPGNLASEVEVFSDNIVSMAVSFRELWFFGQKKIAVYEDTGGTSIDVTPYQVVPSGFMESGCGAQFATVTLDNTLFWIESDERGNCIARRANGYNPARVSTHAIEYAWSQYSQVSDAVGYAYQDQGHAFWVIYFPSGNATWVFDAATHSWHERAFWNYETGVFLADRARCHAKQFEKHLIGDWRSGNVYEQSIKFLTDVDDRPIRRIRRAIHLSNEDEYIKHNRFQLSMETGLGPTPPLPGLNLSSFRTSITLADSSGGLWLVTIDNNGILSVTSQGSGSGGFGVGGFGLGGFGTGSGGTGIGETIILLAGGMAWQLGVTTFGNLTTTSVPFDPLNPPPIGIQLSGHG